MGPTASGKTEVAIALKKIFNELEIISVDSSSVYREMNIGTAKPTAKELLLAPHRLIDIRDPNEFYSVANFCYDALYEMNKITQEGSIPLLVGGTMLYFQSLLYGLSILPASSLEIRNKLKYKAEKRGWMNIYEELICIDPDSAKKIHYNDHHRIIRALEVFYISGKTLTEFKKQSVLVELQYKVKKFAIVPLDREFFKEKIKTRFYNMLDIGLEQEADLIFSKFNLPKDNNPSSLSIGYRQMWEYFSGKINYNDMIVRSIYLTKNFAKKQLTWLRKFSNVCFLDSGNLISAIDIISRIYKNS